MINYLQAICFSSFVLILSASAEVSPPVQERFSGTKASKEIQRFMTKHWHRQTWQIEYKSIEGFEGSPARWHVKGSFWWVELDGPEYLLKMLDLNKLDKKKTHEFVGIPVNQGFGVITFYVLSPPKVIVPNNNKSEQGVAGQPATRSESE